MPPLPDAFAGQHSAIAVRVTDGIPVISGYFGQPYGDLIFGVADSAEAGASVSWSYIDGVPADAECVGAADGPRGGIAEPGEDVGWDTDLALNNGGWARISYYDRDNGTHIHRIRCNAGRPQAAGFFLDLLKRQAQAVWRWLSNSIPSGS